MTRSHTKTPLESFGPELFNALIEGSKRKITIPTDYRTAVKFRIRVHQLRHRLREDAHPLYGIAARTKVTIEWDETKVETIVSRKKVHFPKNPLAPVTLTIAPHDSQFSEALAAAGIDVKTPLDSELLTSPQGEPEASPERPTLDDLLKDFK